MLQVQQAAEPTKRGSCTKFLPDEIPRSPADERAACSIHTGSSSRSIDMAHATEGWELMNEWAWLTAIPRSRKLFPRNREKTQSTKILCFENIALCGIYAQQ